MKLIIITPNETIPNETAIINELFSNGLECLHVRKYGQNIDDISKYIDQIAHQYHKYLVICDHFVLLKKYDLSGAHLSSYTRNEENKCNEIYEHRPKTISTSFHSWQEFSEAANKYDYAFISPVFDSISKYGYKAAIDLSGANALKKAHAGTTNTKIIGLGGVDNDNISQLYNNQFDGAAVLGAVWQKSDAVSAFQNIYKTINALTTRLPHC